MSAISDKIKKRWDAYQGRGWATNVLLAVVFVLFFVYALTLLYPFLWAFLNSLKTNPEYWADPFSLPKEWRFDNYLLAFSELSVAKTDPTKRANLLEMLFNSVWFTFGSTFLNVACSAMIAYALSKYKFRGSGLIYGLAIFTMMIPIVGSLPAMYKLVYSLHIDNSPLFLVTACGGFGFTFIVLYGFFKNVSWSYAEAAFIDGAGNWRVFLSIMIPQARAALLSVFIVTTIDRWNDYMTPLLYLKDFPTLSTGLFVFKQSSAAGNNEPVYLGAMLMSVLPIVVIFIVFQNTIMDNMVAGGLKG